MASGPHTPLGEPITSAAAAAFQASDPLTWHLSYWLNIEVIGQSLDEDAVLMAARIDREGRLITNAAFRTTLQNAWHPFQAAHRALYEQRWAACDLTDPHSYAYLRDLARLLTDKGQKMRGYLALLEEDRDQAHRDGNDKKEQDAKAWIARVELALQGEETRDAEARRQLAESEPQAPYPWGEDGAGRR